MSEFDLRGVKDKYRAMILDRIREITIEDADEQFATIEVMECTYREIFGEEIANDEEIKEVLMQTMMRLIKDVIA